MKILFIDDELKSNEFLVAELVQNYRFHIDWIRDIKQLSEFIDNDYDAIILDIMLPIPVDETFTAIEIKKSTNGLSTGFVLLDQIRKKKSKIPILIYSARGDIQKYITHQDNIAFIQKPKNTEIIVEELTTLKMKQK